MRTAWRTNSITKFYIVLSRMNFKKAYSITLICIEFYIYMIRQIVLATDMFLISKEKYKYESFIFF